MKITNSIKHFILFIQELWRHPQAIGAICPSSTRLARKMAAQISKNNEEYVIEIGAGTGAITKALLEHGILASHLIVVEQSHTLATHLHETFPEIQVIEGDAAHLTQLMPANTLQIKAIVSSLPLRSLPAEHVSAILQELHAFLPPEGKLIQFTYDPFSQKNRYMPGFQLVKSFSIWLNLPPAKVQVFKKN